ncbi:MAG: glycoside hydrolase family 140 protein [Chitinophagaceae bacterium]
MKFFVGFLLLLGSIDSISQGNWKHGRLKVTNNGHSLQYEDGFPFFWLGDTGWELFHRLKKEEIANYLDNRSEKGFNLIQSVILAEFNGLKKANRYNQLPLKNLDPTQPNETYFELIDWTVKEAMKRNIFMGLLPTWGDKVAMIWGEGPLVFNLSNAYTYGLFLGRRYRSYQNIVWILGGDRPATNDSNDWRPIWRAMAKGIKEGTQGKAIFTYHISGGERSTSFDLHSEEWLAINMMQSGHGGGHDVPVWNWIERDRLLKPAKPTLDSEPNYEDHPVNPWPKWDPANGYFRDYDVRKQCYRSVFAGACGVTYGHHSIWQFYSKREEIINYADRYWQDALDRPGAFQVGYLRKLIESRPFLNRIPDQSIIAEGQGEKGEYATAFRDEDGNYLMVYLPVGKKIVVNTSGIKGKELTLCWFNPRTGKYNKSIIVSNRKTIAITSPSTGIENDWVLLIDNASKKISEPGK